MRKSKFLFRDNAPSIWINFLIIERVGRKQFNSLKRNKIQIWQISLSSRSKRNSTFVHEMFHSFWTISHLLTQKDVSSHGAMNDNVMIHNFFLRTILTRFEVHSLRTCLSISVLLEEAWLLYRFQRLQINVCNRIVSKYRFIVVKLVLILRLVLVLRLYVSLTSDLQNLCDWKLLKCGNDIIWKRTFV